MPRTVVEPITDEASRRAAVAVWAAARAASGHHPTPARVQRVTDEVAAAVDRGHVALLARRGERVAGVLLAEPYRTDTGGDDATCGHLAMVRVDPAVWGFGLGGALVRAVQRGEHGPGWTRLSVWARESDRRALRLYRARGFVDTGDRSDLHEGEVIHRYEWHAGGG